MKVALLMGSDSDLARLAPCVATLRELEVPFVARVLSAHRSPQALVEFVEEAPPELGVRVFLAASGYDHPTYVMDPKGEVLAKAHEDGDIAVATIDLNKRYSWEWLGEMRGRFFHEIRRDVPVTQR